MRKEFYLGCAVFFGVWLSGAAHASESSIPAESNLALTYHGELTATEPSASLWSLMVVGWKLDPRFHLEVQGQSTLRFVGGAEWQTMNPRVGVSALLISNPEFYLWANANVEPPLTADSRRAGIGFSPGSFQMAEYMPSRSRFSVGAEHWLRYYPGQYGLGNYDAYGNLSPLVHFRTGATLLLEGRVSFSYFHFANYGWKLPEWSDLSLEPGVSWNPMPNFNVRPYLSFRAQGGTSPAALPSAFGLWVTGTFL